MESRSGSSEDAELSFIEADNFDPIQDYDNLSLPPREGGIWEHVYENGRRYHLYKHGRYPMPNDDMEQQREDLKHSMMLELTDNKLFHAPIGDNPKKIIDIGTGTGIWAIEMGDMFPKAQILGVDLSPIQPEWIPENVRFVIDDCESEWANGSGWDFAHFRQMVGFLLDPDRVIKTTFEHLRPGGWIEFQELHGYPFCDDGTMPDTDPVVGVYDLLREALELRGMNNDKVRSLRGPLRRAGFTNIQLIKKKIPLGFWPRDPQKRLLGCYLRAAVLDVLPGIMVRPISELGLSQLEQEVWMAKFKRGIDDTSIHRHFHFYFWYAQKPEA